MANQKLYSRHGGIEQYLRRGRIVPRQVRFEPIRADGGTLAPSARRLLSFNSILREREDGCHYTPCRQTGRKDGMDSSFGERMQNVHATLRQRFDKLSRVAIAIYDQHTDRLKTFAHSTEGSSPLVQYEVKLSEVPSLRYLAEHKQPRVLDTLDSLLGSPPSTAASCWRPVTSPATPSRCCSTASCSVFCFAMPGSLATSTPPSAANWRHTPRSWRPSSQWNFSRFRP